MTAATRPDPAALIAAREALLPVVLSCRWVGEPPRLWVCAVEALRRIEDELGMPHTVPTRAGRRERGRAA